MTKLVWAVLLACALALNATCPSPTGPCAVNCTDCSGVLNCAANSLCTVNCSKTFACSDLTVTGVYQPTTNGYSVVCNDSFGCSDSVFTTRTSPTSRFHCIRGCSNSAFICRSNNCELVCDGIFACSNLALRCPGGAGKTCNIQCNDDGCFGGPDNVTCDKYPCSVTYSGNQTNPSRVCAAGLRLCGDGSCVNSSVTTCPSECLKNDPCKTASTSNTCADVGGPGGPHNCTCNTGYTAGEVIYGYVTTCVATRAPTRAPTTRTPTTRTPTTPAPTLAPTPPTTPPPTLVPTSPIPTLAPTAPPTSPPEGYSLTITSYSNNNCSGTPSSTVNFPTGACASGTPGPGQFAITRCTATKFYQILGTGTCGGFNFVCSPSVDTNVCLNGTMAVCNMNLVPGGFLSGAARLGVGAILSSLVAIAMLLF